MKTSTKIIISSVVTLGVAGIIYAVVSHYNKKNDEAETKNVTAEAKANQIVFTRA